VKAYRQTGGKILQELDWKLVLASGLTVAMTTGTHEIADGVQEGIKILAEHNPQQLLDTVSQPVKQILHRLEIWARCLILLLLVHWFRNPIWKGMRRMSAMVKRLLRGAVKHNRKTATQTASDSTNHTS
jgi:hypothetical protein